MVQLVDGVSFVAASTGTVAFVYNAARTSFITPAQAVTAGTLADGQTVSYVAVDSLSTPTEREWGRAVFSSATNTFTRAPLGGTAGAATLVNFTVAPTVMLTALAEDFKNVGIVSISDAANQTFNAQNGMTALARQVATADRTLVAPTNPLDGQRVIIEFTASGGARSLTLTTGSAGTFEFGSDIVGLTQTASGLTDEILVIYNATANRWRVSAVVKGFS